MPFPEPEYHSHEEFQLRKQKLVQLRELGIDPYPAQFTPTARAGELQEKFADDPVGNSEEAAEGETPETRVAGRLILFRAMGKNAFGHIQDESKRLQIMCNRDLTEVVGYDGGELSHIKLIQKLIDLGDLIGVEGHLFRTQKGELTLFVKKLTILCKTLLPLPEKHSGLTDKEVRYRKRWLDLISHDDVVDTFQKRSRILAIIRDELQKKQFIEVETPALQNVYGGAAAKPFETHLNSLQQDMFLRISLEPSLKKLIAGGLDRIFEIGKVFRNEGIDRNHNPEFTMLEAYGAYLDYNDMMELVEQLCERIALDLYGDTKVAYEDKVLNFKAPWKRLTMVEAIKTYANIDVEKLSTDELRKTVEKQTQLDRAKIQEAARGLLITFLFEELVEEHLIQPQHIIDHPIESTPLCKPHRNPERRKEGIVERFESFILTHEICNAYSELNDPILQRDLLLQQAERREGGDEEASPLDEDFIEAICQGMPPTGGIGIGIDRLVMLFTNAHSIRDVLYFPLMRRES